MAEPAFVLHLGGSTYVDVSGKVLYSVPPGAVVLRKPPDVYLDPATIAAALKLLIDPGLPQSELLSRWQDAGQKSEFAQFFFKISETATIIGGVMLSVSQPPALVIAVILGVIISAFAGSDGADDETKAGLKAILDEVQGQGEIRDADVLLEMRSKLQGGFETLRSKASDLVAHKPIGAARLTLLDEMRRLVDDASAAVVRIRDEDWIATFSADNEKSRFGLSPILNTLHPNGGTEPISPQQDGLTRFDYRLGIPMLMYVATAYPSMMRLALPHFRSVGSYRDQLRSLAAALDRLVAHMQADCLARTEHTGQSLFAHSVYPNALYFGSPFAVVNPVANVPNGPDRFPVGAFDLVRYSDGYIFDRWARNLASHSDEGKIGTFDFLWTPPAPTANPVGDVWDFDGAADAANAEAARNYGELMVATGAVHLLIASALLRYLSAPPTRSETVHGSTHASRTFVQDLPTEATSPRIFPAVQIKAPATLKQYRAANRVRASTEEPGLLPPLRYRVVLRTIDSLFSQEAWRDRDYIDWVWRADLDPLASDPENLRLQTEFSSGAVLDEVVLYEGVSPINALPWSPNQTITLQAHTFDWYVPVSPPRWVQGVSSLATAKEVGIHSGANARTAGARSIHLTTELHPIVAARLAGQPQPTLSYSAATREALLNIFDEYVDDDLVPVLGPSLEHAERRHVRPETVTLDYQFRWADGQIEVRLNGRPENRNFQVFVVIEEAVQSGEAFTGPEWLHTPFAAEMVNQLTLVPQSFFDDEKKALEAGERLWNDLMRHYSKSGQVGPGDPVTSVINQARALIRESVSTAALSESLAIRLSAVKEYEPELWRSVTNSFSRRA